MNTLRGTRNTTGFVILTGHVMNIIWLIILFLLNGYTFEEMTNIIAVIAPIFAAYLTVVVEFAFKKEQRETRMLSPLAVYISLGFPALFMGLIAAAIGLKAFNIGINSMDYLIGFIGIVETTMGAYVSTVIKQLFEVAKSDT